MHWLQGNKAITCPTCRAFIAPPQPPVWRWVHAHADRIAPEFGVNGSLHACRGSLFFSVPCGCFSEYRIYLDKTGQPYFGQISIRNTENPYWLAALQLDPHDNSTLCWIMAVVKGILLVFIIYLFFTITVLKMLVPQVNIENETRQKALTHF